MGKIEGGIGILLIIAIIAIPLLVFHFLISPNIDGFFNDLSFYEADKESAHFLYWFFFWGVASTSAFSALKVRG
jgi:hypothetical protein